MPIQAIASSGSSSSVDLTPIENQLSAFQAAKDAVDAAQDAATSAQAAANTAQQAQIDANQAADVAQNAAIADKEDEGVAAALDAALQSQITANAAADTARQTAIDANAALASAQQTQIGANAGLIAAINTTDSAQQLLIDANVSALTAINAAITDIKSRIYSPAGASNESNWVYEDIAGVRVEAFAISGSEDLTKLLSVSGAQANWYWVNHGKETQWRPEYSHLFREGMFVVVDSVDGVSSKLFRVKANTTEAQRLINPSDPSVSAAASAYEPWAYS